MIRLYRDMQIMTSKKQTKKQKSYFKVIILKDVSMFVIVCVCANDCYCHVIIVCSF